MPSQSTNDELKELARLYVQNQDLSGKSPAEIYTMYAEAYDEIKKEHSKKDPNWFSEGYQ